MKLLPDNEIGRKTGQAFPFHSEPSLGWSCLSGPLKSLQTPSRVCEQNLHLGQTGNFLVPWSSLFVDFCLVHCGGLWATCLHTMGLCPTEYLQRDTGLFLSPSRHYKICSVENSPTNTSSSGPPGHVSSQLASSLEDNQRYCARIPGLRGGLGVLLCNPQPAGDGLECLWSGDQGDPVRHQGFCLLIF